jgi:thiol-disulfide isomerase/thioredoxin
MPMIVYIGATWCGTCKTIKPEIERLGKMYGVQVNILDYDDDLEPEEQEQIRKVPTIRILDEKGNKVATFDEKQVVSTTEWLRTHMPIEPSSDF